MQVYYFKIEKSTPPEIFFQNFSRFLGLNPKYFQIWVDCQKVHLLKFADPLSPRADIDGAKSSVNFFSGGNDE